MIDSSSEVLLTMTCKEVLFSENEVRRDFQRGFLLRLGDDDGGPATEYGWNLILVSNIVPFVSVFL